MEQNSQANNESKVDILEAQIRECYGRVVYSHKTQEKCADIIFKIHKRIKLSQIILSAIVTTSILVKIFGENQWSLIVGAIFSTLLFGLNAYIKDYDLGEIAQKHTAAANELWDIRETYLSLLADIKSNLVSIENIINKRNELQNRLLNVYSGSPRTNSKAYMQASRALKQNEELTFNDKEIDAFLPKQLRKTEAS